MQNQKEKQSYLIEFCRDQSEQPYHKLFLLLSAPAHSKVYIIGGGMSPDHTRAVERLEPNVQVHSKSCNVRSRGEGWS